MQAAKAELCKCPVNGDSNNLPVFVEDEIKGQELHVDLSKCSKNKGIGPPMPFTSTMAGADAWEILLPFCLWPFPTG
eukprot:8712453-Ditylum_brightwellii.AAC.1